MRDASDRFLAALRASHVARVDAELVVPGAETTVPLEIEGGTVSGDRMATIRRIGDVTTAAALLAELGDTVLPYGAALELYRGIRYPDGSTEEVQLGFFRIGSVGSAMPDGSARIGLADRMAQIADEKLLAPYDASGKTPTAAIVELAEGVFPDLSVSILTTPESEPELADVAYATDRDRAIADLAKSIGAEAYFDATGELVIAPIPDPAIGAPVWTVDAGADGVLISRDDYLERAGVCNGVLVVGQATAASAPISALVTDNDPTSPTFWGGPFGKVPLVLSSQAVQSEEQAEAVATAELARRLGLARTLTLTSVPNPALEPGDVVQAVLADGSSERHVIDRIQIPLSASLPIQIESRSVWTAGGGSLLPTALRRAYRGRRAWREVARSAS